MDLRTGRGLGTAGGLTHTGWIDLDQRTQQDGHLLVLKRSINTEDETGHNPQLTIDLRVPDDTKTDDEKKDANGDRRRRPDRKEGHPQLHEMDNPDVYRLSIRSNTSSAK